MFYIKSFSFCNLLFLINIICSSPFDTFANGNLYQYSYITTNKLKDTNTNIINIGDGFYSPVNLFELNSDSDDFAPEFNKFENKLYFNSTRTGYSKFYISTKSNNNNKNFVSPLLLKSPLNETSQNVSYITFLDEKTAFLSSFIQTNSGSFLNIHKSLLERNSWSKVSLVEELLDTSFNSHPTISPNGEMLVFSSTRKNKKDTDLWLSFKQQDGSWGMLTPINELNSAGNEITPHFASDSILIFASDGFYGPGGYDLYYSIFTSGSWTKPIPLNDINTEFNESDAILLPDGEIIFASDRINGLGKLDLYYAIPKKENIKKEECEAEKNMLVISSPATIIEITKFIKYNLAQQELAHYKKESVFYKINPTVLQINLDWNNSFKPREAICIINQDTLLLNLQTKNILYDLSKKHFFLYNFDKLKVLVSLTDSNNYKIEKNFELDIISHETKELIQHEINNKKYYRIFTVYDDALYNSKNPNNNFYADYININKEVLNAVKSLLPSAKSITLFSNNSLSDNFLKQINTYFSTSNLNIKNILNKDFLSNTIEIRVEIL